MLDAVIDHIATRGISDLSLRELAAAIGTSHRMLIHHFGGAEGLRVAVVREVEDRQRSALADVVPDPDKRLDMYIDLQRQVQAKSPIVIMFQAAYQVAMDKGVTGYVNGATSDFVYYRLVEKT